MHTGVAVETGPVVRTAGLPCGVCRTLTGGVARRRKLVETRKNAMSEHLDLVAAVGVEQAVIGGPLGLLGFHRCVGAHRQPLGWRDRRNTGHQGLDANRRDLGVKLRDAMIWRCPAHAAHSDRNGT